mgnify:FL=1
MELLQSNWEWILLAFMIIEKTVKLSPTDKDDIIVDIIWQSIKKVAKKG